MYTRGRGLRRGRGRGPRGRIGLRRVLNTEDRKITIKQKGEQPILNVSSASEPPAIHEESKSKSTWLYSKIGALKPDFELPQNVPYSKASDFKLNANSAPFIPSTILSPPTHSFREVIDPKSRQWVFGRVERKDPNGYFLQLIKPNLKKLPFLWVPYTNTADPGTNLTGDPEMLYEAHINSSYAVSQPYSAVNAPIRSNRTKKELELPPGCTIVEAIDPKTQRWVFAKILSKDRCGYTLQLLNKEAISLPIVWVPFKDVQKVGTFFKGSDAGHLHRTFFTRLTSRRNPDDRSNPGRDLGSFGEWFEYVCGHCNDMFPSERPLSEGPIRCTACRKLHHYGGYGVTQRPEDGWLVYNCTVCNRRYPSIVAYRGAKPRCLTCRDEHNESHYADSPCLTCGVAHSLSECKTDVGGPAYRDWIQARMMLSGKSHKQNRV